ncbi:MAG: 6-phosphofructokinase [Endomicrobiales bacterium]|nr:6-phosphofructokinase [Endomicrobiales bacterium]
MHILNKPTKLISLITLAAFIYSFILHQPALAVVEKVKENRVVKELQEQIDKPALPANLGRVVQSNHYDNDRLIIYIQDLHCHAEVQKNICKIIEFFDSKYGVNRIFIEGAPAGKVDTSLLNVIKDEKLKNKALNALLEKGLLGGAEYYSIIHDKDELYGTEDWKTYNSNIHLITKLIQQKETNSKTAKFIENQISLLKEAHLSKDIKKLEKYFAKENRNERHYLKLEKLGEKVNENIHYYSNLSKHIELIKLRKSIKYKKLPKEITSCLNDLKKELPFQAYNRIAENLNKKDGMGEFYNILYNVTRKYPSNFEKMYPNLSGFLRFNNLSSTINPIHLLKEEKLFTDQVVYQHSERLVDKELLFLSKMSENFSNFIQLELSAKDFEYFNKNSEKFVLLLQKYLYSSMQDNSKHLNDAITLLRNKDYFTYYETNLARNDIFIKNVVDCNSKSKSGLQVKSNNTALQTDVLSSLDNFKSIDIVIAGGFHGDITHKLKEKCISCMAITPNVTTDYDRELYEQTMTGNVDIQKISYSSIPDPLSSRLARIIITAFQSNLTPIEIVERIHSDANLSDFKAETDGDKITLFYQENQVGVIENKEFTATPADASKPADRAAKTSILGLSVSAILTLGLGITGLTLGIPDLDILLIIISSIFTLAGLSYAGTLLGTSLIIYQAIPENAEYDKTLLNFIKASGLTEKGYDIIYDDENYTGIADVDHEQKKIYINKKLLIASKNPSLFKIQKLILPIILAHESIHFSKLQVSSKNPLSFILNEIPAYAVMLFHLDTREKSAFRIHFQTSINNNKLELIEDEDGMLNVRVNGKIQDVKTVTLDSLQKGTPFTYSNLEEEDPDRILYRQWIGVCGLTERNTKIEDIHPPVEDTPENINEAGTTRWRGDLTWYTEGDFKSGELNRSKGHVNRTHSVEIFQVWTGKVRMYLENETSDGRISSYFIDLNPGESILIPPGWYHTTHIIEGPAAVFNSVNREGFVDWGEKGYAVKEAAYTFRSEDNLIIPVKNPNVADKLTEIVELAPTRIPILENFNGSLLDFITTADDKLLERLAQNILTGQFDKETILAQQTISGTKIPDYYEAVYGKLETFATRDELEILDITPPKITSKTGPLTYLDVLCTYLHLDEHERNNLQAIKNIDRIASESVKDIVKKKIDKHIETDIPAPTTSGQAESLHAEEELASFGYKIIKVFTTGGGIAQSFLAIDPTGQVVVVKYCRWEGIDGNGMPWLRNQIMHNEHLYKNFPGLVPKIIESSSSENFVFYSMEVLEGVTLNQYLLSEDATPATFLEKLSSMYDSLGKVYRETVAAAKDYLQKAYLGRLKRRVDILGKSSGEVYKTYIEGRPVTAGNKVYRDTAELFEEISKAEEVVINGVKYPSLSHLITTLEEHNALLERLSPRRLSRFWHGDGYLGNIMDVPERGYCWIDVRGKDDPEEPGDVVYDIGKNLHTIFFDLAGKNSNALQFDFSSVRFENDGKTVILDLKVDPTKEDVINRYLEARRGMLEVIANHPTLREVADDGSAWFARALLAEAVNIASDAPNRIEDDPHGGIPLTYYLLGVILLNEFLQSQEIDTGTEVGIDEFFSHLTDTAEPLTHIHTEEHKDAERVDKILQDKDNCIVMGSSIDGKRFSEVLKMKTDKDVLYTDFSTLQIDTPRSQELFVDYMKKQARNKILVIDNYETLLKYPKIHQFLLDEAEKNQFKIVGITDFNGYRKLEADDEYYQKLNFHIKHKPLSGEQRESKVVVIGASGFIGRKLYNMLRQSYPNVIGTRFSQEGSEFINLDSTDPEAVRKFVDEYEPDIVIYASAITDVVYSEANPEETYSVNVNPIEHFRNAGFDGKFVFFSTDYVVDDEIAIQRPFRTSDKPAPLNVYAQSKRAGEERTLELYGDKALIIRPPRTYGYTGTPKDNRSFERDVIDKLQRGEDVYLDGSRTTSPVILEDVCSAIAALLSQEDASGIFQLSTSEEVTKFSWARMIAKTFGLPEEKVHRKDVEYDEKDPPRARSVQSKTSYTPLYNLRLGIQKIKSQLQRTEGRKSLVDMARKSLYNSGNFIDRLLENTRLWAGIDIQKGIISEEEIISSLAVADREFTYAEQAFGLSGLTAEEIDDVMEQRILDIDRALTRKIGNPDPKTVDGVKTIIETVVQIQNPSKGVFVKRDVLKELLTKHPPEVLMKSTGRSMEDLIADADVLEIFSLVRFTESEIYLEKLMSEYENLTPEDFEEREIEIRVFPREKYKCVVPALDKKLTLAQDKLAGTVFGIPYASDYSYDALVLRLFTRVPHHINELINYSDFYRHIMKTPESFSERFSECIYGFADIFGKYGIPFFHPHHIQEVLNWEKSFEVLEKVAETDDGLINLVRPFLKSTNAFAFIPSEDGTLQRVSINLIDRITNVSKAIDTQNPTLQAQESIRTEIWYRHVGNKRLARNLVVENLDDVNLLELDKDYESLHYWEILIQLWQVKVQSIKIAIETGEELLKTGDHDGAIDKFESAINETIELARAGIITQEKAIELQDRVFSRTVLMGLSGGDCAGLNPALASATRELAKKGILVAGIDNGFQGLSMQDHMDFADTVHFVRLKDTDELEKEGSFRYGSSRAKVDDDNRDVMVRNGKRFKGAIMIGGDDHSKQAGILANFLREYGVPVVAIPKSVDFDFETNMLGTSTMVEDAHKVFEALEATAKAHNRISICEIMGRNTGWLAFLSARNVKGNKMILIPERPATLKQVLLESIRKYAEHGYLNVMISEGFIFKSDALFKKLIEMDPELSGKYNKNVQLDEHGNPRLSGVHRYLEAAFEHIESLAEIDEDIKEALELLPKDIRNLRKSASKPRATNYGFIGRGLNPNETDQLLGRMFGTRAAQLIIQNDTRGSIVTMDRFDEEGNLVDPKKSEVQVKKAIDVAQKLLLTDKENGFSDEELIHADVFWGEAGKMEKHEEKEVLEVFPEISELSTLVTQGESLLAQGNHDEAIDKFEYVINATLQLAKNGTITKDEAVELHNRIFSHTVIMGLSGGDCAGLNSALASTTRELAKEGILVAGVDHGFQGISTQNLLDFAGRVHFVKLSETEELEKEPSFRFGSSRVKIKKKDRKNIVKNGRRFRGVIMMGDKDHSEQAGRIADSLKEHNVPLIAIPNSVDFDFKTNMLGVSSIVEDTQKIFEALGATARAHNRISICEIMGRERGWLAFLSARNAEGNKMILVPEKPVTLKHILLESIRRYGEQGYLNVMISEGFKFIPDPLLSKLLDIDMEVSGKAGNYVKTDEFGHPKLSGVHKYLELALKHIEVLAEEDEELERALKALPKDSRSLRSSASKPRVTDYGFIGRGLNPNETDIILGKMFGKKAAELIVQNNMDGVIVAMDRFDEQGGLADPSKSEVVVRKVTDVAQEAILTDEFDDGQLLQADVFWGKYYIEIEQLAAQAMRLVKELTSVTKSTTEATRIVIEKLMPDIKELRSRITILTDNQVEPELASELASKLCLFAIPEEISKDYAQALRTKAKNEGLNPVSVKRLSRDQRRDALDKIEYPIEVTIPGQNLSILATLYIDRKTQTVYYYILPEYQAKAETSGDLTVFVTTAIAHDLNALGLLSETGMPHASAWAIKYPEEHQDAFEKALDAFPDLQADNLVMRPFDLEDDDIATDIRFYQSIKRASIYGAVGVSQIAYKLPETVFTSRFRGNIDFSKDFANQKRASQILLEEKGLLSINWEEEAQKRGFAVEYRELLGEYRETTDFIRFKAICNEIAQICYTEARMDYPDFNTYVSDVANKQFQSARLALREKGITLIGTANEIENAVIINIHNIQSAAELETLLRERLREGKNVIIDLTPAEGQVLKLRNVSEETMGIASIMGMVNDVISSIEKDMEAVCCEKEKHEWWGIGSLIRDISKEQAPEEAYTEILQLLTLLDTEGEIDLQQLGDAIDETNINEEIKRVIFARLNDTTRSPSAIAAGLRGILGYAAKQIFEEELLAAVPELRMDDEMRLMIDDTFKNIDGNNFTNMPENLNPINALIQRLLKEHGIPVNDRITWTLTAEMLHFMHTEAPLLPEDMGVLEKAGSLGATETFRTILSAA